MIFNFALFLLGGLIILPLCNFIVIWIYETKLLVPFMISKEYLNISKDGIVKQIRKMGTIDYILYTALWSCTLSSLLSINMYAHIMSRTTIVGFAIASLISYSLSYLMSRGKIRFGNKDLNTDE